MTTKNKKILEPYKGLRYYEEQDQDIFFGRENECAILVDKILSDKLTLLFAATGVGKSSLLNAAVIPTLKSPDKNNLDVVYFNDWVLNPIHELKKKSIQVLRDRNKITENYTPDQNLSLKDFFRVCSSFAREPFVIMLDQFEEFFQYQRYQKDFKEFIKQLSAAINDREAPVVFVISMREDFALELNAFKEYLLTTLFQNFFRLEKLEVEKAKQAIIKPAQAAQFKYEPGLLDEIIKDLAQREQQRQISKTSIPLEDIPSYVEPPYLQIVCAHLWKSEKDNPKKIIRKKAYHEKGRAKGFVESYFQDVMDSCSATEKKIASLSFNHLITPYGTKMAYPTGELSTLLRVDEKELKNVLKKLAKARVLRSQKREDKIWYELYHDIFSNIIYDWNEKYKAKQRKRKSITFAVLGVVIFFILLAGYDIATNYSNHHLRLSSKAGISDNIELYRGKAGSFDILDLQDYEIETSYKRNQIEPDKLFFEKNVPDYDELQIELIGKLPLVDRLEAYWKTGEIKKALELADKSISASDMTRTRKVINLLAGFRSEEGFEVLKKHLKPSEDVSVRKAVVEVMGRMEPVLVVEPLIELLKDQNSDVKNSASSALNNIRSVKVIPTLIQLLQEEDSHVRKSAANVFGNIRRSEGVAPLIQLLKDQNSDVRQSAVSALGNIRDVKAVEPLIELLKDKNSYVRRSAASALGSIGDVKAVEPLIQLLKDQELDVLISSADALGKIGNAGAVVPLTELLKKQYTHVRESAADALVKIGDVRAVNPLIGLLKYKYLNVRQSAAYVLGVIGDIKAITPLFELLKDLGSPVSAQQDSNSVINLLQDRAYLRDSAVSALGKIKDSSVVILLIQLLKHKDSEVRKSVAEILGKIGNDKAFTPLLKLLKDRNSNVRSSAANSLGKIGDASAIAPLIELLGDRNSNVRSSAANSLGKIGDASAIAPLIELLGDRNFDVRNSAANSLGKIGDASAIAPLIELLRDRNSAVRNSAANLLGKIGEASAITPLIELLKDQDSSVRSSAASALSSTTDAKAVQALIELLKDQDSNVRSSVASALSSTTDAKAVEALIELLKDQDSDVRCSVASALGKIRDVKGVDPLIELLKDQNSDVRNFAASALGKIRDVKAVEPLIELLKDQDLDVRISVINGLARIEHLKAVEPLSKLLNKKQYSYIRYVTANSLGRIRDVKVVEPLIELLKDVNSEVRSSAAYALCNIREAKAINPLIQLLKDQDSNVRSSAILALGKLSVTEKKDSIKKLYKSKQESEEVKLAAAVTLLCFNDEIGLEFLKQKASSRNPDARRQVVEFLGKTPSIQGTAILIQMLNDKNRNVRIEAISSLGSSKDKTPLPYLRNLLKDSDHKIRQAAIKSLSQIGSHEYIELFKKIATDEKERVSTRLSAITALGNIKTDQAVDILLDILQNEQETFQARAIMALGNTNNIKALPPLLQHLENQTKIRAKWRKIRDENTESYSEKQIEDWQQRLKQINTKTYLDFELGYSISRIAPETQGIQLLSHELADVRYGAWMGLGKIGTPDLIEKLYFQRNKNDASPWFCHAAYRAIDHILINIQAFGGKKEMTQLEKFLPQIKGEKNSGIKTRVEWTIDRLKERV